MGGDLRSLERQLQLQLQLQGSLMASIAPEPAKTTPSMGALHVAAHLAQWRARAASLLDGHAVSIPEAVIPIDKDLWRRAFGAESSFS